MRAIILGSLLLVACGDDGGMTTGSDSNTAVDTPASSHTAEGTVVPVGGGSAPAMGDTVVIWVSDIGQGDFIYKWGMGTATSTTWTTDVMAPVPSDATFGGKIGVGMVMLVASGSSIPDGVVPNSTFNSALGYTGEYAIIFRPDATNTTGATWVDAFPVGLSCGKCVPQSTGFDTFTPVSCSSLILQAGPTTAISGCNWT